MKIKQIRLESFKSFRQPLDIKGLTPGLNIFAGPNASGKSTLATAIRAAFVERHKSKMETFAPDSDMTVSPSIALDFENNGDNYHLLKRFNKRQTCNLNINGVEQDGDLAEATLTEFLGFSHSGAGQNKDKNLGIPGLLWISQGHDHEIGEAVEYAKSHLQSSLDETVGEVASTDGDQVAQQVSRMLEDLVSAERQTPRNRYAEAIQSVETLKTEVDDINSKLNRVGQNMEELIRHQEEFDALDITRPWEAMRANAASDQSTIDAIHLKQRDAESLGKSIDSHKARQRHITMRLEGFNKEEQAIKEQNETILQLHTIAEQQNASVVSAQAAEKNAWEKYRAALAAQEQGRKLSVALGARANHKEAVARLATVTASHASAVVLEEEIKILSASWVKSDITQNVIDSIRDIFQNIQVIEGKISAAAAKLFFDLESGQVIQVNGNSVQGRGELPILDVATIVVPGVGALSISAGAGQVADLVRERDQLWGKRDAILQRYTVSSLAEAEQNMRDSQRIEQDINNKRRELTITAPKGVAPLLHEISQLEDAIARALTILEVAGSLPEQEEVSEESLNRAAQHATQALSEREKEHGTARERLAITNALIESREERVRDLKARIEDIEWIEERRNSNAELVSINAELQDFRDRKQAADDEITASDAGVLQSRINRMTASAMNEENRWRDYKSKIDQLRARIDESLSGEGVTEAALAQKQAELSVAERRLKELADRVESLKLLTGLIKQKRAELIQRIRAPLQARMSHYLRMLFPAGSAVVGDDLLPGKIVKAGQFDEKPMDFEVLSYGTRQQIGILSRLAYADLLQEAGRPTLIIFDDVLGHADAERRRCMKDIIYDASQRHQILMFTCQPENWRDLGVQPINLLDARAA
jgi:DNA repair exonuclease SbcCD ATPase subunit